MPNYYFLLEHPTSFNPILNFGVITTGIPGRCREDFCVRFLAVELSGLKSNYVLVKKYHSAPFDS